LFTLKDTPSTLFDAGAVLVEPTATSPPLVMRSLSVLLVSNAIVPKASEAFSITVSSSLVVDAVSITKPLAPSAPLNFAIAVFAVPDNVVNEWPGEVVPMPTLPVLVTLKRSDPSVSTVTVSTAGKRIAVFVSPL